MSRMMEVEPDWASLRCQLCNVVGPGKHGEGGFINTTQFQRRQIWVHKYCLHASLQVCNHCNRRGASLQCRGSKCTVNYHLLCAMKAGCGLDTSRSVHASPAFFCPNHIDSKAGKKAERAESLDVWIEALECQDEEAEEGRGKSITVITQYDKQTEPGHPEKREMRGPSVSVLGRLFSDCYREVCKTFSAIALPTDLCRICRDGHVRPSKTEPEDEEEEDEDFDQVFGEAGQKPHRRPVEPTASRNDAQRKLELDVAVTMLKCSDCGLSVHASCYGNTFRGTLWLVSAIEKQLRRKRANRLYKDVEWQCNACSYVRTCREMQAIEDKTSQAAQLSNSTLLESTSQIALPDTAEEVAALDSVGNASANHKQPHTIKLESLPLDKSTSVLGDKTHANAVDETALRKHVFTCQLCPVFNIGEPMKCFTFPGGAKRSDAPNGDVGWVHLLCCLWSCDVRIYDVDEMLPSLQDEPGEGVKPEGAPSYNLLCKFGFTTCVVCQKASAPGQSSKTIECADLYCGKSYHPVCALERKVFVDHFPKEELFQSEGRRSATVSLYCVDHAPQVVYCYCKRPYSPHQFMVECDTCKDWFHGECVGIREPAKRKKVSEFECDSCRKLKKKGMSPSAHRIAQNQAKGAKQLQLERRGLVERDQKAICSLLARYRMWLEQIPFKYISSNFLKEALQRSMPWSESDSKNMEEQQIPTLEETTDFLQRAASFLPLPFGFQSIYDEVHKTLMKKQSEALELERKAEEACEEAAKCTVKFKVGFQQIDASDVWKLRQGLVSSLAGFVGVQVALKSILTQASSLDINLKCHRKLQTLAGSVDWLLNVRTIWDTQSHARKWVPFRDLDRIMSEYSSRQTDTAAKREIDNEKSSVISTQGKGAEPSVQGIDEVVHLVGQHVSEIRKKSDIWRREAREVLVTLDWQSSKSKLEGSYILDAIIALSDEDRVSTEEAKVRSTSEGNTSHPNDSKSVTRDESTAGRSRKGQSGKHSARTALQATTNKERKTSNDKAIAPDIPSEKAIEDKSMLLRGPHAPSSKTSSVVQKKTFGSWENFLAFMQRGDSLTVVSPERTCCLHIASLAKAWKTEVGSAFYACTSLSPEEVKDFVDRKSVIPVDLEESKFLNLLHQRHLWLQKAVNILASETERHSKRRSRQEALPGAGVGTCPTGQEHSTLSGETADQARALLHKAMTELQGHKPTLSQLEELLQEYEGLAKTLEFAGETTHINGSASKERATRAQEMQCSEGTDHSASAVTSALGVKVAAGVVDTFSAPNSVDSSLRNTPTCSPTNSSSSENLASSGTFRTTSLPGSSSLLGSPSAAAPDPSSVLVSHSSNSYDPPFGKSAESFLLAPIRKTSVRVDISDIGRLQMRAIQVIMHNGRAVTAELKEELQKVGLEDWARIAALKQRLEELEAWDPETAVKIEFAFELSKWFSSEGRVYHVPPAKVAVQAVGLPSPRRDFVASLICGGSLSNFFCEPFFIQARYFLNYVKNMHSVSQRASELVTKGSVVPRAVVEHVFACGSEVLHGLMHDSAVTSLRRGLESAERWDTDFALFLETWAAGIRRGDDSWRLWLSSELMSLRRRLDEGAALSPVAPDGLPVCRATFNVARFIVLVDKVQNWTPQVARALLQKGAVLLMQLAQVSTVVVKLLSTRRAFCSTDQSEGVIKGEEIKDGDKARQGESREKCGGWTRIDTPGCEWRSKFLKEILSFATDRNDETVVARAVDSSGRENNEEMNSRKTRSSSLTGVSGKAKSVRTVESKQSPASTKQTTTNHQSARTQKLHALETTFYKLLPVEASGSAEGCRLEFQWGVNTALYDALKSLYHFLWYVEAKRATPFSPDRPIAMPKLRELTEYSLFECICKGRVGDTRLGGKVVLTQFQSVALGRYIDATYTSAEKLFGHLQYILKNVTRRQQIEDAQAFLKSSSVVFEDVNQALHRLLPTATWLEEAAKATSSVFSPVFSDDSERTHEGLFSRQLELRRTLWRSAHLSPCGTEWADRATNNLRNLLVSLLCLRTSWLATALNHVPSAHQNKYDVMDEALNAETIERLQVLRYQRWQRRCEVLAGFSSVRQSADGLDPPTPSWSSSGPHDTELRFLSSSLNLSSSFSQPPSRNVSGAGAWQVPAEDTVTTGQGQGQRPAMWHSRKDARHAEVPASQPLLLSAATCLNSPVLPLTAMSFIPSPRIPHPAPPPAMHPSAYALPSSATGLITVQYKTFKGTLQLLASHQICSTLEASSNSMAEDARRVVAELESWDVMARVALNKSGFEDTASTPATGALERKSNEDTYKYGVTEDGAASRPGEPSIGTSGSMVKEALTSAVKDQGREGGRRSGRGDSPMDLGEALVGDAWGALLVLAGRHRRGSMGREGARGAGAAPHRGSEAPELCKNELKTSKSHASNLLPSSTSPTTHTAPHESQTNGSGGARHAETSSSTMNAAMAQRTSMARVMQRIQQDLEHIRKQKALSVADPVGLYLYWTRFTGISARLPHLHGIPALSNRILAIAAMLGFAGVGLDRHSLQGPRQPIRTQSRWKLTHETRLSVLTEVRLLEELRRELTKALADFERQCSADIAKGEEREQRGEPVADTNTYANAKSKVEMKVLNVETEKLGSAEPEKKVMDLDAETLEGAPKDERVRIVQPGGIDSVNRQEEAKRKTEALARQLECLTVASWSWYNLSQLLSHYREWEWRVMRLLLRQDLPYQCLRFIRLWEELLPFDSHLYSLVTTALLQTDHMKQAVPSEVSEESTGATSPEKQSEVDENKEDEEGKKKNDEEKLKKSKNKNGGKKEVEKGKEEKREKSEILLEDKVREGHAAMEVKLQDGGAPATGTKKSCAEMGLRDDSNHSQDSPVDCDASVAGKTKVDQHSKVTDDRKHGRDIQNAKSSCDSESKHETYSTNVGQNTKAKRDTHECNCGLACSPETGDVVWAKVGSLPFWPALVYSVEPSTKLSQSDPAVKMDHNRANIGALSKSSKTEARTRTSYQARATAPRRERVEVPSSGKSGHSELKREWKRERLLERNEQKRERLDENKACERNGLTDAAGGGRKFASHNFSRKPDKLYTIRFFALPSSLLSCEVHDGPCACLQNDEGPSELNQVTENGPGEKPGKTEVPNEHELRLENTEDGSKDRARRRSLPMYHHLMHTTKFFSQWVNPGASPSSASGIAPTVDWQKYISCEKAWNSAYDSGNDDQESEKVCNKLCSDASGDQESEKDCNELCSGADGEQQNDKDWNKHRDGADGEQVSEKDSSKECSGERRPKESCFVNSDVAEGAFPTVGEAASLRCRPSDVLFAALDSAWPSPDVSMPSDDCVYPSSSPSSPSPSSLALRSTSQLSAAPPPSSVSASNNTSKVQPSVSSLPTSSLSSTEASKGSGSSSTHVSDFHHPTSTVPSSSLSSTNTPTKSSRVSAAAAGPPSSPAHLPPLSKKKHAEVLFASSSKSNLAFSIGGASVVCWTAGLSRKYPSAAASAPLLADALSEVTMYLRGRSEHILKNVSRRAERGAEKGKVKGRKNGRAVRREEEDEGEDEEEGVGREGEQRQEAGERKQGRGRQRALKRNDEEESGGDLEENKNRAIEDRRGRDTDAEALSMAENPNPLTDKFRKPVKGQYKRVTSASSASQSMKRKHSASERWISPPNGASSKRLKQKAPNVALAHTSLHTHSHALGPSSPHSVQRGVEMKGEEKQLCKFCGNRASEKGSDRCSRLKCRGEARVALLIRKRKRTREDTMEAGAQRNESGRESGEGVLHGGRALALSMKGGEVVTKRSVDGSATTSSSSANTSSTTTTNHSSSTTASSSSSTSAPSEGVSNAQRVGPQRLLWSEDQKLGGSKVERMRNKFKLELQSALLLPTFGQEEAESEDAGSDGLSGSQKPKAPATNERKSIAKSSDSEARERQREMMLEMEDTRGEGKGGACDNGSGSHLPQTEKNAVTLAESLESALFKRYPMTMSRTREGKGYAAQARALMFNLKSKDNFELRRLVWTGRISPDRLAEMRSVEMASSSLKKWRQEKDKEHVRAILLAGSLDKTELR